MSSGIFEVEQQGDVVVATPKANLRELEFDRLEEGAEHLMELLESEQAKHLVMDFSQTDYYGSTALSFFVKLWKRVTLHKGCMVLCGVSSHEREILEITRLNGLWPIYESREEAIAAIKRMPSAS